MSARRAAAGLMLALALAGCSAPGTLRTSSTAEGATMCREDEPCWHPEECLSNGNRICGPQDKDAAAAWTAFNEQLAGSVGSGARVTYMGTAGEGFTHPDYPFKVAESGNPSTYYLFKVEEGTK